MHIRAGNGETGDFQAKDRGINDIDEWVKQATRRISELTKREQWKEPPLLYIATDTPSIIDMFRSELEGVMPVIDLPQERREQGDGVLFGETSNKVKMSDYYCIRGWEYAVADMILLSHADMLIAGRMSSFEQTMPMSLVFGRKEQKVMTPKCELNLNASEMICSKTYLEWCCDIDASQVRTPELKETLRVPRHLNLSSYELQDRPPADVKMTDRTHLPYYWKTRAYDQDTTRSGGTASGQ